ncbi:MAG: ATP-binding protein [Bacteroidales bacterium]|nr:ATP-binding protein [Bacteroidales bacterium]
MTSDYIKSHRLKNNLREVYYSYKQVFKNQEWQIGILSQTVSAMANSVGGTILIGAQTKGGRWTAWESKPSAIGLLSSLEDLIQKNISPAVPMLKTIEIEDAILIQVPESTQKAHMCSNVKFYKRSGAKNIVMEEYEIRTLYQKQKTSDLQIVQLTQLNGVPQMMNGLFDQIKFYPRIIVQNIGQKLERWYKLEIRIPSAIVDESFSVLHKYLTGYEQDANIYTIPSQSPIFQNESISLVELVIKLNAENYMDFINGTIHARLYSSEQVHEQFYDCKDWFHYQGQLPPVQAFAKKLTQ